MKKIFIINIRIDCDSYDLKKGDIIPVPVFSNNRSNALRKFINHHNGSEYPVYTVLSVIKENNFFYALH